MECFQLFPRQLTDVYSCEVGGTVEVRSIECVSTSGTIFVDFTTTLICRRGSKESKEDGRVGDTRDNNRKRKKKREEENAGGDKG